jgi:hypothetical protein
LFLGGVQKATKKRGVFIYLIKNFFLAQMKREFDEM